MAYTQNSLSQLQKKSIVLDYSLIKELKLTLKEFSILEQLAYNTNKKSIFAFQKHGLEKCAMSLVGICIIA
ncbi:hypothetical protein LS73_008335 [Helicobacter muridarum]|uniref:Uncharacterized protein n=1 Tax=Helicobacter muridarum TaxID=216 RepID=A0A099U0K9_9HELI|nr:hypothetical protein [Helicobacter muridarum]TLD98820.1 hypothetical protein LS73_008335 [Helicobacter muridarum]STQ85799.1 Uncharacterised protein [Helicobacter muridarum]